MDQIAGQTEAAEKTRVALASLWERKRPEVENRLQTLERAARAVPLPEQLRIEAHDIAHKLAGSLGMFGFPQGTAIASKLEQLLEGSTPDSTVLATLVKDLRELLFPVSGAL